MNIESELKPCPFCGGEAEIIDDVMGTISRCRRCGAENGNGIYGEGGHKLALKDWNSRPIEDDLNEQIGRFKKYAAALEKEVKTLRAALETILDASQQDDPCVLGIRVVAYEALKEVKNSD